MSFNLYTPKTIRKIRDSWEPKRNFLTALFFAGEDTVSTEEIMLEITKGGERVAPFVTPLESGRPVYERRTKTNLVIAPNIAPSKTLGPKDFFVRDAGMDFHGRDYSPAARVGKRIAEILKDQEGYIANKEELMVSQFLTTGKVTSVGDDASYEVDYELDNMTTLAEEDRWDKEGVNPLVSLGKIISKAEKNGVLVENVVMGVDAADALMEKDEFIQRNLSKDMQTELVKEICRTHPGIIYLGFYKTYSVNLFRYERELVVDKNTKVELMPSNMIVGGPTGGKRLYAPVINMGNGDAHQTKRFSDIDIPNKKQKNITTESRPVLEPRDMSGYFNAIVCGKK